jgi:hypothetical protein
LNTTNISFSMKHLQLVVLSMYVKYPIPYQVRFCHNILFIYANVKFFENWYGYK